MGVVGRHVIDVLRSSASIRTESSDTHALPPGSTWGYTESPNWEALLTLNIPSPRRAPRRSDPSEER